MVSKSGQKYHSFAIVAIPINGYAIYVTKKEGRQADHSAASREKQV